MAGRWLAEARGRARHFYNRSIRWVIRHVPPGGRTLLGVVLIVGGMLGFLPVLGFWMLPLGVGVVLLDVTLVRRWWRRRR